MMDMFVCAKVKVEGCKVNIETIMEARVCKTSASFKVVESRVLHLWGDRQVGDQSMEANIRS